MKRKSYFNRLMEEKGFCLRRLSLKGIDNDPVKAVHGSDMDGYETCLFFNAVESGEDYYNRLDHFISEGMATRTAWPVVRFADGEFAFYARHLHCNGLYKQAESVDDIKKALPYHIEALTLLSRTGIMAPLICPANTWNRKKYSFSRLFKSNKDDKAIGFLEFLSANRIRLTDRHYIPFFVIYAYLTSETFARRVDKKKVVMIGSDIGRQTCRKWFSRLGSRPEITVVDIPDRYTATKWPLIKDDILNQIPPETDICLVGAGIGALLICVDVAEQFHIPAVDAGHVVNMINDREDKSDGPRLYTVHTRRKDR